MKCDPFSTWMSGSSFQVCAAFQWSTLRQEPEAPFKNATSRACTQRSPPALACGHKRMQGADYDAIPGREPGLSSRGIQVIFAVKGPLIAYGSALYRLFHDTGQQYDLFATGVLRTLSFVLPLLLTSHYSVRTHCKLSVSPDT
jgi:hypothetical protein